MILNGVKYPLEGPQAYRYFLAVPQQSITLICSLSLGVILILGHCLTEENILLPQNRELLSFVFWKFLRVIRRIMICVKPGTLLSKMIFLFRYPWYLELSKRDLLSIYLIGLNIERTNLLSDMWSLRTGTVSVQFMSEGGSNIGYSSHDLSLWHVLKWWPLGQQPPGATSTIMV